MPKKLSEGDEVADPVRSRLASTNSRMSALASRAAAAPRARTQPQTQAPPERTAPLEPEPVREVKPAPPPSAPEVRAAAPAPTRRQTQPEPVREAPRREQPSEDDAPSRSAASVRPAPAPSQEATTVAWKARFTPTEADANSDLLRLICRLTESKPSQSSVTRVLWTLLREAEAELKQVARHVEPLRRPPNGSSIEMAAYEQELGRFLLTALKRLEL